MKRTLAALIVVIGVLTLPACATAKGAALGAGVGAIAGDTQTGAVIGGSVGALSDIL